eukprot:gene30116-36381_t
MGERRVKLLKSCVSDQILASSGLASFHRVVEELVLNSIDAQSTSIYIKLDIQEFGITVIDNGIGISELDLREKVGEWNFSSKDVNEKSYGCKGKALAAIRHIAAVLQIASWTKHAPKPASKSFTQEYSSSPSCISKLIAAHQRWQGTIVVVGGLFDAYKVRQKSLQSSTERYHIVEFVKKMSILHHHISWEIADQDQTLFQISGCLSVSKRLISLHGLAILGNLVKVHHQDGNLTLQGLLSPPNAEVCHWTKGMQYSYLNHRYCRNSDVVSLVINNIYSKLLQPDTGGPKRKHTAQKSIYPVFVLHCICPPSEYDILVEPDKTKAYFRNEDAVKLLVAGMMKTVFKVDVSSIVFPTGNFDGKFGKVDISGVTSSGLPSFVATAIRSSPLPASPVAAISPFRVLSSQAQEPSHDMNSLFEEGFGEAGTIAQMGFDDVNLATQKARSTPLRSTPLTIPQGSAPMTGATLSNSGLSGLLQSQERVGVRITRVPVTGCDLFCEDDNEAHEEICEASEVLFYKDDGYLHTPSFLEDDLFDDHSFESLEPEKLAFFDQFRCDDSVNKSEAVINDTNAAGGAISSTPTHLLASIEQIRASTEKRSKPVRSSFIVSSKKTHDVDNERAFIQSYPVPLHHKSLQISKQQLGDISYISQWDGKFLLGYDTTNSVLVAFDQHAVHERILFEKFAKELTIQRSQLPKPVLTVITIEEYVCFNEKKAAFEKYGFSYTTQRLDSRQRKRKKRVVDDFSIDNESFGLEVTALGSVLDEDLTVPDLMEYCHDLMKSNLPDHMVRPSAIARVLASKACRTAVKFNTILTRERAMEMLAALGDTDMPFQCAHGRPSVVPLAELSRLKSGHPMEHEL